MEEEDIIKLEDVEIKYEALSSDEELEFQFEVGDNEYEEILREIKLRDSDLEEVDEAKVNCPHDGCKKSFSRNHNLLKHLRNHESGLDKLGSICHICGKTIKGVYSLHLKIHENSKQFRCDECGKEFRQKVALNNHLLIHRNEKPHECPWCSKRFRQKYTMQHHMKNRHTGVKEWICHLCGKEFSDKATLQKHSLVHSTSKPHQCSTCFMSFRHKSSLSRHNKIHLKVTQCLHCNRSFRYESFLKKHLQTAHQSPEIAEVYSIATNPKEEEDNKESISIITYDPDQLQQTIQVETAHYYSQPMTIAIEQRYTS